MPANSIRSRSSKAHTSSRPCKGLAVVLVVLLIAVGIFWPQPEVEEDLVTKTNQGASGVVVRKEPHGQPPPTLRPTYKPSPSRITVSPTVTPVTAAPQPGTTTTAPITNLPTTAPTADNNKNNNNKDPDNPFPPICSADSVPLPNNKAFDVWFTCEGPIYDQYMPSLINQYGSNRTIQSHVLPPNSRILLYGNGHTRQLAQVMVCQQAASTPITALTRIDKYAYEITFGAINATLLSVTNTYAAFAAAGKWQNLLQSQIRHPLSDFTTIVWGLVDECQKDGNPNAFTETMLQLNMDGVDCMIHDPPTLQDWLNVYAGPLLFVSPWTTARRMRSREAMKALRQASQEQGRRVGFVHGRQYLEGRADCMAASRSEISDCLDKASTGNPCQGDKGGWVDLMAWDVSDFLWTTLTTFTTITFSNVPAAQNVIRKPLQHLPAIVDDVTFCRSPLLQVPSDVFSDNAEIHYQCAGPLYDALIDDLHPYARDESSRRTGQEWWGKRNFALPPNRRILFYGNSHTRQVALQLACQQMELGHLDSIVSINTTRVHQWDMSNNSTMVVVVNSFAPYSHVWLRLTEEEMGMTLDSFDAIVVGAFNNCQGDNAFSREMQHFSKIFDDVDCINIPPPSVTEISQHFKGPIIYVTMFVKSSNEQDHALTINEINKLHTEQNRTNVHFVEARKYIDVLHDCRAQLRFNVSDCYPLEGSGGPTHECTGPQGGHADLIAWDVIEHLYRELGE